MGVVLLCKTVLMSGLAKRDRSGCVCERRSVRMRSNFSRDLFETTAFERICVTDEDSIREHDQDCGKNGEYERITCTALMDCRALFVMLLKV